ncbi:hypothetical protein AB1Y20_013591 [Prymnesium parvum]|uniref:NACHT domain-containing protein n=1 Tax=Prymnesium parvum TaxID=97485 RepID=A0AB34IJF2_PRYPA
MGRSVNFRSQPSLKHVAPLKPLPDAAASDAVHDPSPSSSSFGGVLDLSEHLTPPEGERAVHAHRGGRPAGAPIAPLRGAWSPETDRPVEERAQPGRLTPLPCRSSLASSHASLPSRSQTPDCLDRGGGSRPTARDGRVRARTPVGTRMPPPLHQVSVSDRREGYDGVDHLHAPGSNANGSFTHSAVYGRTGIASPISRALAADEAMARGVDIEALAEAEAEHTTFRQLIHAKVAPTVWSTPFLTKQERKRVEQRGAALGYKYNHIAMECLEHSPEVAYECLQRAFFAAPRNDPLIGLTLTNLGICCLHRGKPSSAARYLKKLVTADADGGLQQELRVRARLNLCVAESQLGRHRQGLFYAHEALALLRNCEASEESLPMGVAVLRAVALHNSAACHEHLGQHMAAHHDSRRALRLAETSLPESDALLIRLRQVEQEHDDKCRKMTGGAQGSVAEPDRKAAKAAAAAAAAAAAPPPPPPPPQKKVDTKRISDYNFLRATTASTSGPAAKAQEDRATQVRKLAVLDESSRLLKGTASSLAFQNGELQAEAEAQLNLVRARPMASGGGRYLKGTIASGSNRFSDGGEPSPSSTRRRRSSVSPPPSRSQPVDDSPPFAEYAIKLFIKLQAHIRGWIARANPKIEANVRTPEELAAIERIAKHVRTRSVRRRAKQMLADSVLLALMASRSAKSSAPHSNGAARRQPSSKSLPILRKGASVSTAKLSLDKQPSVKQITTAFTEPIDSSDKTQRDTGLQQYANKLNAIGLPLPLTLHRGYGNIGGKTLRVFLSSTFRDMQEERQMLLKRYIPALRQLLSERGVYLTVVDLRWGVTAQQAESGETVDICLSEVAASNYFVSFLGHRAGWRPQKNQLAEKTFHNFPFILSYIPGGSVTELEVVYGALGWGKGCIVQPRSAFFYVRKEEFIERLPQEEREIYYDPDKMAQIKLRNLKRRIVQRVKESEANSGRAADGSRLPFVECYREYTEPADFAEHVYVDLLKAIERDYPLQPMPNPMDAEMIRHISFARPLVRAYVGRQDVWKAIDNYCYGDISSASLDGKKESGQAVPLVLHGPPGCGKTAAFANWLLKNKASGFVLPHFVGCTSSSTEPAQIVRRILEELRRAFELEGSVPHDDRECTAMLPLWLARASSIDRVVILIDGLDELHSGDDQMLGWLPAKLPAECRIVLGTQTKSVPHTVLAERGVLTTTVDGFTSEEKHKAACAFLDLVHKALEPDVLDLLTNAYQTANPLFLRLTLEELKASAVHETVKQMTEKMLGAKDAEQLCQVILERFEGEFGEQEVCMLYSLIFVSRYGMTEEELSAILGMAPADWSPFFLAARETLSISAGRLNIGIKSMRLAVRRRYFSTDAKRKVRQELITFFSNSSNDLVSPWRRVEELPYHIMQNDDLDGLLEFCLNIGNVRHLLSRQRGDLRHYWMKIGTGTLPTDVGTRYLLAFEAYDPILRAEIDANYASYDSRKEHVFQDTVAQICSALGEFLYEIGMQDGALILLQRAFEIERTLFDALSSRGAKATVRLAKVRHAQGRYGEALQLYYGALGTYKHLIKNDPESELNYAKTLVDIAECAQWTDDTDHAKGLSLMALKTFRSVYGENSMLVSQLYNKLAILTTKSGRIEDIKEAKKYLSNSLKIVQHIHGGGAQFVAAKGDPFAAEALHTLGKISVTSNHLTIALSCFCTSLNVYQKLYGPDGIETAGVLEDYALCLLRNALRNGIPTPTTTEEDNEMLLLATRQSTRGTDPEEGAEEEDSIDSDEEAAQNLATTAEKGVKVYEESDISHMLAHALEIRLKKQPPGHIQIAHCYVHEADWCWYEGNLPEVIKRYEIAIDIFTHSEIGFESKEVAQLSGWVALCHAAGEQYDGAFRYIEQAFKLSKKTFGAESWQVQRTLCDKAFILEDSVIEKDENHRPLERSARKEGKDKDLSVEARRAFSMAERMQTQAEVLRTKLKRDKVRDDVLPLSVIAPRIRLLIISRDWRPALDSAAPAKSTMKKSVTTMGGGKLNKAVTKPALPRPNR